MKNLSLILICIANIAFSQEKPNNDLKKHGLNGKVKSVREIISHNTITQTETGWDSEIFFNPEGYITEIKKYFGDGILASSEKYEYDNKHNIIESINDGLKIRITYTYDANNYVVTDSIFENSEKWTEVNNYKYDEDGNMIIRRIKTKDSEKVVTFNYDLNINPFEPIPKKYKYKYDNNNNWILKKRNWKTISKRTIIYY
jgi:hypothetical protein